MKYWKWLILTLSMMVAFALLVVAFNLFIDHHGVRLSLFGGHKAFDQTIYPDGLNQHMFNPERIFRSPEKYDSFLFGSSRTSVIDVDRIATGKFCNMSYSLGLPDQHLAITKAFLKKGIRIKTLVIGLDEISFDPPPMARAEHLVRIMHPDIGGPSRLTIFGMYFFRKPPMKELSLWKERVLQGKIDGKLILSGANVNLGWLKKDNMIEMTGRPLFNPAVSKHAPVTYNPQNVDEAFAVIEEFIALARAHHFELIFYINPFYAQLYLDHATALFAVKERLAALTDFYDFSGLNSVTINPLNYYDADSHYNYKVGALILDRIFDGSRKQAPDDFGVKVTRANIKGHLEDQRQELNRYLREARFK